jgi:hypothetical protein
MIDEEIIISHQRPTTAHKLRHLFTPKNRSMCADGTGSSSHALSRQGGSVNHHAGLLAKASRNSTMNSA